MINNKYIYKHIKFAGERYRFCWRVLLRFKSFVSKKTDSLDHSLSEDIWEFQPKLASAIFRLDEAYRELYREREAVVAKKREWRHDIFIERLRKIKRYRTIILNYMAIGKNLGDAFAWIFYSNYRDELDKHYKHERIKHTPPGVGGQGELAMICNMVGSGEHFPIYHGITTFLRVGDISFFDIGRRKLIGIAELKTRRIDEKELEISFNYVGEGFPTSIALKDSFQRLSENGGLGQSVKQRLVRQIEEMQGIFETSGEATLITAKKNDVFDKLREFPSRLNQRRLATVRLGDGLILVGVRSSKLGLARRLFREATIKDTTVLSPIVDEIKQIADMNSKENQFFMEQFAPHTSLGATPFLWWPLPFSLLRDCLFHNVEIITIYNPLFLMRKFQSHGFIIKFDHDHRKINAVKSFEDGSNMELYNFEFFFNMIRRQLLSEESLVDLVVSMENELRNKNRSLGIDCKTIKANIITHLHW